MPTHDEAEAFLRDYRRLTPSQRDQFLAVRDQFIADLKAMEAGRGQWFRPRLVRKLSGRTGLYELRWAPDGRATFSLGEERRAGHLHVRWHRCGTHEILP